MAASPNSFAEEAIVYTETVVHAPPMRYSADAPYQLAIVEFGDGQRRTVRIDGDPVAIGERVRFSGQREGIAFYRKAG